MLGRSPLFTVRVQDSVESDWRLDFSLGNQKIKTHRIDLEIPDIFGPMLEKSNVMFTSKARRGDYFFLCVGSQPSESSKLFNHIIKDFSIVF